jgi:hypothetical protein
MSLQTSKASNRQIVRVLQICLVLEEVVEARATRQATRTGDADSELRTHLRETAAEAARHRKQVAKLVERTDANTVPFEDVERLVADQFEADSAFEDVLYDQLCYAETTYKLYDDLVMTIEGPGTDFGNAGDEIVRVLGDIRTEKALSIRRLLELMNEGHDQGPR